METPAEGSSQSNPIPGSERAALTKSKGKPLTSKDDTEDDISNISYSSGEDNYRKLSSSSSRTRPKFIIGGGSDSDSAASISLDSLPVTRSNVAQFSNLLKPIKSGRESEVSLVDYERNEGASNELNDSNNGSESLRFRAGLSDGSGRGRGMGPASTSAASCIIYGRDAGSLGLDGGPEVNLIAVEGNGPVLSRRQWLVFAVFVFVELLSAMVISLQAPFFPMEAELKGVTPSEYGFVFGVFDLTVFLVSPVYGSQISKIGPKLVFNLGIFTTAVCAMLFGFLDQIEGRVTFVALAMLTRILEAFGQAAFITASFVIIAAEFPQSVATTFATMETCYGLGLIAGPLAGGALYQLGGYTLPFLSVGGVLLCAAVCTHFVLPKTEVQRTIALATANEDDINAIEKSRSGGFQYLKILRIPSIAVSAFSVFAASSSVGYLNATLEPHVRQFNLTPLTTGSLFIVNGGVYALSAPFWGWLCDRIYNPKYVTLIGSIFIIVGFSLIGPIPYIPLETTIWGVIVGQVIQGIGLGAVLVSAFIQSLRDARQSGLFNELQMYGLVSAMWTSMFALGSFVGPSVSGVLYDIIGFRRGTLVIIGLQSLVLVSVVIYICCWGGSKVDPPLEEMEALLRDKNEATEPRPSTSKQSYGAV